MDRSLDRLEKRMWATYQQDGMWDIFLGVLMLMMGLRMIIDHWIMTVVGLTLVIGVVIIKKMVTEKRIGMASWSSKRRSKKITLFFLILLANIATLLLIILSIMGVSPDRVTGALVIGGMILITFSAISYFMYFWRFILWGSLLTFAIVINEILDPDSGPLMFFFIGSAAVALGFYYLVIFLREHQSIKEVI